MDAWLFSSILLKDLHNKTGVIRKNSCHKLELEGTHRAPVFSHFAYYSKLLRSLVLNCSHWHVTVSLNFVRGYHNVSTRSARSVSG